MHQAPVKAHCHVESMFLFDYLVSYFVFSNFFCKKQLVLDTKNSPYAVVFFLT